MNKIKILQEIFMNKKEIFSVKEFFLRSSDLDYFQTYSTIVSKFKGLRVVINGRQSLFNL